MGTINRHRAQLFTKEGKITKEEVFADYEEAVKQADAWYWNQIGSCYSETSNYAVDIVSERK